jgi:hypothetical protein
LPISLAESLFKADFAIYNHAEVVEAQVLKTESASVPEELRSYVTHLPHITYFPQLKSLRTEASVRSEALDMLAYGTVTPDTIIDYYGIDNWVVKNGATQAIFSHSVFKV